MAQENLTGAAAAPPAAIQGGEAQGQVQEPAKAEEAKTVPLSALEDERRMKQEAQREVEIYKRKAELLEQAVPQQPEVPGYDPEELPQFKDVDQLIDKKLGAVRQENIQTQMMLFAQNFRDKHTDFDDVFNLGLEIATKTPGMADMIANRINAAELVYTLGKTHPSFMAKSQQRVTQEVAETINKNLNSTKTLSEVGGGGAPSIEKDWTRATHEEIEAKKAEIRNRIR